MPIPDYQSIMLPLLKFASDKKEHSVSEAYEYISKFFNLTTEDKEELLPSGTDYVFNNRVRWAKLYLLKAGLLESTRRSFFRITDLGLWVLKKEPKELNVEFLKQFSQFVKFKDLNKEKKEEKNKQGEDLKQTPQELIEYGYKKIKKDLASELLMIVKQVSPRFFEKLVVELLVKMGYGGSLRGAGKAIGQSRDGGIDGIIKEDKLGLDVIYIQAKRWNNLVSSKEIRDFVGSLVGKHANKGIFITTSNFTEEALKYIKTIPQKVVLIDGELLAELMIENNVGVSVITSYDIKKIDLDYFEEE